jgi:hypothetical protein
MNRNDPAIKGENLHGKMSLHLINSQAPPMVHVTRSIRPEVVLFGQEQRLQAPFALEAGKSTVVKADTPDRVVISRFALGEPDREMVTGNRVDEVIRGIVDAGGHYPDVVQFLHAAKVAGVLASRFEVEAVPPAGRQYDRRQKDGGGASDGGFAVLEALPNLFGSRGGEESDASVEDSTTDSDDGGSAE